MEDGGGEHRVRVTFGDRTAGGPGWKVQPFDETHYGFKCYVDATGDGEFVLKTLDSAGIAFEATTDSEGKLWLIAGTDSGFEGLTQLYYSEISASLAE